MDLMPHIDALLKDLIQMSNGMVVKRSDIANSLDTNNDTINLYNTYEQVNAGTYSSYGKYPVSVLTSLMKWSVRKNAELDTSLLQLKYALGTGDYNDETGEYGEYIDDEGKDISVLTKAPPEYPNKPWTYIRLLNSKKYTTDALLEENRLVYEDDKNITLVEIGLFRDVHDNDSGQRYVIDSDNNFTANMGGSYINEQILEMNNHRSLINGDSYYVTNSDHEKIFVIPEVEDTYFTLANKPSEEIVTTESGTPIYYAYDSTLYKMINLGKYEYNETHDRYFKVNEDRVGDDIHYRFIFIRLKILNDADQPAVPVPKVVDGEIVGYIIGRSEYIDYGIDLVNSENQTIQMFRWADFYYNYEESNGTFTKLNLRFAKRISIAASISMVYINKAGEKDYIDQDLIVDEGAGVKSFTDYLEYDRYDSIPMFTMDQAILISRGQEFVPSEHVAICMKSFDEYVLNTYAPERNATGISVTRYHGETNDYYRTLNGLPSYTDTTEQPEVLVIEDGVEVRKKLYDLTDFQVREITENGKLDKIKSVHTDKAYLDYLGDNRVDTLVARRAPALELLRLGGYKYKCNYDLFKIAYDTAKSYVLAREYHPEIFSTEKYYEAFIVYRILALALSITITKSSKLLSDKLYEDEGTVDEVLASYGYANTFKSIPLIYRRNIAKNISLLIRNKGIDALYKVVYNVFNMYEFDVSKYYLLKNRDETFSFLDVSVETKNILSAINNNATRLSYDSITKGDIFWGLDNEETRTEILNTLETTDFNYMSTKYIALNNRFSLTEFNFNVAYFLNYLLANKDKALFTIQVEGIQYDQYLDQLIYLLFAILSKRFMYMGNIPSDIHAVADIYKFNTDEIAGENPIKTILGDDLYGDGSVIVPESDDPLAPFNDLNELINKNGARTISMPTSEFVSFDEIIDEFNANLENTSFYKKLTGLLNNAKNVEDYVKYAKILEYTTVCKTSNENYKFVPHEIMPVLVAEYSKIDADFIRSKLYYPIDTNVETALLSKSTGSGDVANANGDTVSYIADDNDNPDDHNAYKFFIYISDNVKKIYYYTDMALTYAMHLDKTNTPLSNLLKQKDDETYLVYLDRLNVLYNNIVYAIEASADNIVISYSNMENLAQYIKLVIEVFKSYTIDISRINYSYMADDPDEAVRLFDSLNKLEYDDKEPESFSLYTTMAYDQKIVTDDTVGIYDEIHFTRIIGDMEIDD